MTPEGGEITSQYMRNIWEGSSPYLINMCLLLNNDSLETIRNGSLTAEAIAIFQTRIQQVVDLILNDVENLARRLSPQDLKEFLEFTEHDTYKNDPLWEDPPQIANTIRVWLEDATTEFNKVTGLGNDHRKRWHEISRRNEERSSGEPLEKYPNYYSGDDRIEAFVDRILPEINSELKQILRDTEQRFELLSLSLKPGEVFAGNRAVRRIFDESNTSLEIIDAYIGPAVFDMLEVTASTVQIRILTEQKYYDNATKRSLRLFGQQYGRVELRFAPSNTIHDRYIIVDKVIAFHLGHSIKDLGRKMSEINRISDVDGKIKDFESLWINSTPAV